MISIIVPVYNVEKYLEQCINSVLKQKLINFELILVDDGSKDNSGKICNQYEKIDKRVKAIHKKNGGVSSARNCGIENCNGDYIMFLDADDTLVDDALSNINKIIKENKDIDFIINEFNRVPSNNILAKYDNIFEKEILINGGLKVIETIGDKNKEMPKNVWRCVIKSKIIRDNNIKFDEKYICAEDFDFVLQCLLKSESVFYSKNKLINYIQLRNDSTTATRNVKTILSDLDVFSKYFYYFNNKNMKNVTKYFANNYANAIYTMYNLDEKKEIKLVLKHISNNKRLLKSTVGKKYIVAKIIWKICGYYRGAKVLKIINTKRWNKCVQKVQ